MNLQVNQNRQFFVVTSVADATPSQLGQGRFVQFDSKYVYLEHFGKGGLVRSDLIPIDNIMHVSTGAATKTKWQAVQITAPSAGDIQANQNYVLNITLNNFVAGGDENTYMKHGVVHTVANMTQAQFAAQLAVSVAQNFYREMNPFVTVYYGSTKVLPTTSASSLTGQTTVTLIANPVDNYIRGISAYRVPKFTVTANLVYDANGNEMEWLTATDVTDTQQINTSAKTPNTYTIADMEYFCMGERGDQYRTLGNVPVNPTSYMVDESNTDGYESIDIHYYYVGDNESIQKSEKTITIVGPYAASNSVITTLAEALEEMIGDDGK